MNVCEPIVEAGDSKGPSMEAKDITGELIKDFREKFKVSPADLAKGLGITIPQLMSIESEEIQVTQWQYCQMALMVLDYFTVACLRRAKEREKAKESGNGGDS